MPRLQAGASRRRLVNVSKAFPWSGTQRFGPVSLDWQCRSGARGGMAGLAVGGVCEGSGVSKVVEIWVSLVVPQW
jgi:hypothetical protein